METHTIHGELLRRRVRILVVGCGETGSAIRGRASVPAPGDARKRPSRRSARDAHRRRHHFAYQLMVVETPHVPFPPLRRCQQAA